MLQKTGKLICPIRPQIRGPQPLRVQAGYLLQQTVTGCNTEGIVDQLEILDVRTEDIIFHIRIPIQDVPGLLAEGIPCCILGDTVIPELIDKSRCFPQMDNACYPVQDDLGAVGFGEKIRGTMGQSRHLVLPRCRLTWSQ